ncbi:acetoacetate--CoA ligase [Candidatus Odyssella acanthamoebae]|uniref:Acetoacetyl-CoA synthetase n=1 Tax=Candidatus Odyssella acanthamoebae TaxID=91604 RepID=A0A077AWV1_9PROT|nr:acetoacetate--CoA ligase [Candidatus Paracaedibacter acanthamoebae]AIK96991.1 acetoacetyl-CoA synthetase [Candidatus Paracaedibacter acanthamoebae]
MLPSHQSSAQNTPLWSPSDCESTLLQKFIAHQNYQTYEELYDFSITQFDEFWSQLWDFCQIIGIKGEAPFIENKEKVKEAVFFPKASLNYAENLLKRRDDHSSIISYSEHGHLQTLSYADLYTITAKLAAELKDLGVKPGDRITGYLPNIPETIIAMLATASIGAVWSSCSPDFGTQGVIDRFGQISPKVLFITDGYFYNGKTFNSLEKIPEICAAIPSIETIIAIPFTKETEIPNLYLNFDTIKAKRSETKIIFQKLPFNHPLFIMYSSGTTGVPKCIVHGAGGTLLQHLKEHQLHCDLQPDDRLFYFTTCGWMMWNWLVSGLASGATLVLFDGNPVFPSADSLFKIAQETQLTHFGTSAKYLDNLSKLAIKPNDRYTLDNLKMILSTGSPLLPEIFDYVYTSIKSEVCLASISGGTDIVSCFALGNPLRPVWRGELQGRGLGMKVEVYNEDGQSVLGEKGELVCTAPFPSRPIGFWNDPDGQKYHNAYYSVYNNVWHHGDFVEITNNDGLIIYGRSDSVLNPGGVRIGTAEIYRQVEQIPDVLESLAVGQNWKGDVRVILFVKLKTDIKLTDDLITTIKTQIKINTTPRHVPAKIIQVTDIPRTKNGKIVEIAVRKTIHNEPIKNVESLANPESLKEYQNIPELQT